MSDLTKIIGMALDKGFSRAVPFDPQIVVLRPEVRQMCSCDKCGAYGKNWSCPPFCGALEECEKRIRAFNTGLLLQTTGNLSDSLDYEAMMSLCQLHNEVLRAFTDEASQRDLQILPLGAGGCTLCEKCTCPDEPCRFPDRRISAMEAYGIVVSELCSACSVPYYYGQGTLTYVSCVFFNTD